MKKLILIFGLSLIMTSALTFISCTNELEDEATIESVETLPSVPVNLCATFIPFDATQAANSRSTTMTWKEGDVIYLQYAIADGSTTNGIATYRSGSWTASYDKPLKRDVATKCVAYYFDGESTPGTSSVILKPTTGIYADLDASYTYPTGGVLSITCNLKPQTGRIRFKGKVGSTFTLSGLSCGSNLNLSSAEIVKSEPVIKVSIQDNGYSPYIYGKFSNLLGPKLIVNYDDNTFTAQCKGLGMLFTGKSGYMTLPTSSMHNGWEMKEALKPKSFTARGVTFTMIPVEHGNFQMGSTTGESDEKPVHSVTISNDYYIGETEVTQSLWNAVTGYSPTTDGSSWSSLYGNGDDYPAYLISYDDVQDFIAKLNQMTGQKFRMPTEAEWEFAAKGGNKSKGYTYSGSNWLLDVAWYTVNAHDKGLSSRDFGAHSVKTKFPNELGIYDMSGNVWEWCSDRYDTYSSSDVTDPTGALLGSQRVERGGCWFSAPSDCECTHRASALPTVRDKGIGVRLALTVSD